MAQSLGSKVWNLLQLVREFNDFDEDNDPYQEHDLGSINYNGEKYFFKIDYFDLDLTYHSPNPADPNVTKRVMTVMHSSEY